MSQEQQESNDKKQDARPSLEDVFTAVIRDEVEVLKGLLHDASKDGNHDAVCKYALTIVQIKTNVTESVLRAQANLTAIFAKHQTDKKSTETPQKDVSLSALQRKLERGPSAQVPSAPKGEDK